MKSAHILKTVESRKTKSKTCVYMVTYLVGKLKKRVKIICMETKWESN